MVGRKKKVYGPLWEPVEVQSENGKLLFKYAFNEVNLNKLNAWIANENKRSLSFIFETKLKQQWYYEGKYVDVKIFRLLKEEWINNSHIWL